MILFGSASLGGTAEAAIVTCGQVVTQDTVLEADVGPCPGSAIIVGADNITLDLGGHTVFGSTSGSAGVLLERRSGVRVRNGTVTGLPVPGFRRS